MKRKTIILAVVAAAAMALSLVGCGVKITNIAVPEKFKGDGSYLHDLLT